MNKNLRFTKEEFQERLARVKSEMASRGIDILLTTEPANHNYLTGHEANSFYTPQMVIVALDHDEPVWVGRFMDRISATWETWLADDNIRAYPDEYVASPTLSAYEFMARIVKELGGEKARIGVEMDSFYYPARAHADIVQALPNAQLVDSKLLVSWIRMVMSPAEIAIMRQSGQIADAMMQRAIDLIEPGVRECDVAAAVYHQQMAGTPEFGGTYSAAPPFLCVGERAIAPHANWTDDPIPESTMINLELFATRHRYQASLARSISVGEPTPHYQRLSEIVVESLNAGLESVRPGRTCGEIAEAFAETLGRYGYEKESRVGYPIGIGFPPTVQFRTASLRKGDETVLQTGMCFHMMSGLWYEDVGITITQSFAVTETGHEPLTSIPRKLFIK